MNQADKQKRIKQLEEEIKKEQEEVNKLKRIIQLEEEIKKEQEEVNKLKEEKVLNSIGKSYEKIFKDEIKKFQIWRENKLKEML